MDKKRFSMPHVYTLLIILIIVAGIMTYIIPAGSFDRVELNGRNAVVPGTFHYVEQTPVSVFEWFKAIPEGFISSADILVGIFIFVASIGVYMDSGVFHKAIFRLLHIFGKKGEIVVMIILMAFFAALGGFTGNITPEMAFVPMTIAFCQAVGFDVMTGVIMVIFPTFVGFATGPINPYTVFVAQQVAELPPFSGMGMRTVMWAISCIVSFWFVIRYANKVKKDPASSLSGFGDSAEDDQLEVYRQAPFTGKDVVLLILFAITIGWLVLGTVVWDYSFNDFTAVFIISGIVGGIVAGFSETKIAEIFIKYGAGIYFGAMCLALARAVFVVISKGGITDTIVYSMSLPLQSLSGAASAVGMFIFQTFLNFFINSGSGQAMVSMPIMAPLSDLLNVTRQTAVSAFQFGDGLSNLIWPTSSTIFAYLAFGNLKYDKYLKLAIPLFLILAAMSTVFLVIASMINYGPF